MILLRKFILILAALSLTVSAAARHASWKATVSSRGDGLYEIAVTGTIDPGWHIYDLGPYTDGPVPTSVTFELPEGIIAVGEVTPSKVSHRVMDASFGMEIGWWEGEITLTQTVRCEQPGEEVKITVEWMACDATSCTPPDEWETTVTVGDTGRASQSSVEQEAGGSVETAAEEASATDGTFWALILEAVLWGMAALMTPCVFPIIPMTVSFFIKGNYSASRNRFRALMYGVFIVALYTVPIAVIILTTRVIGGDAVTADIFNWLATHWLPNILFFLVFMAFAASFFGAFEIVLPSKLQNGSDSQVDKRRGLGGVFFLALTLVLVSFSCTGPIVGTVLIKSTAGEFWTPIATMLSFSIAFSLPFVFFAMFPSLMKKLPKSGGWLNTVKVVLGFLEIALGFKFLSTADQVYHWGLLDREVYLAVWITVFTLLGFYLLGKLKFKYDSEVKYVSVGRLTLAIIDFAFVVYMLPGMWGAPLKALSGYLPPMETQDFVMSRTAVQDNVSACGNDSVSGSAVLPGHGKYSTFLKMPLGLQGFFELGEAREYAAQVGKPVFIDFTGHGCVNCREMESRVWSDPEVLRRLSEDFVLCALYTDDKMKVSQQDWVTTDTGKVLKTLGKINSWYAEKEFGVAAQPFYVIMSHEGQVLRTRSYDLDVDAFILWLSM